MPKTKSKPLTIRKETDWIPILPDSFIQEVSDVYYLKLKHPIDISVKSSFNRGDPECPPIKLCQMYGELVWKVGEYRYLPFANAVEFVLDTNWKRSL